MADSIRSFNDLLDDIWTHVEPPPTDRHARTALAPNAAPPAQGSVIGATPTATDAGAQQRPQNRPPQPRPPQQPGEARPAAVPVQTGKLQFGQGPQFYPRVPRTLRDSGISPDVASRLILKLLAARGATQGRQVSSHIRLPFPVIEKVMLELRREQFIVLKGEAIAGDYTYAMTEKGMRLAKDLSRECTYFGAAPVPIDQYISAMQHQSVTGQHVRMSDLRKVFSDLLLDDTLLKQLGPAINSGRGMFLFGEPGNGKTSIAERIAASYGTTMWIPRALIIDGQFMRVFDPAIHRPVPPETPGGPEDESLIDHRWIRIYRPTVIAGGELTMSELEVTQDLTSHICEAPLQLKANGGVLLIDDFGRQRMPVDELLNRWIVPLEKRYDLLNLPSGKKAQIPFDTLVIFSTNLEPRDLVDDAFLRRIPYKIQVPNPTPEQFHTLFSLICEKAGVEYRGPVIDYLIEKHYVANGRSLHACHPRDLLAQIRNLCLFEETQMELSRESIDFAVRCYFSVLS
jgi:hypothetical protein